MMIEFTICGDDKNCDADKIVDELQKVITERDTAREKLKTVEAEMDELKQIYGNHVIFGIKLQKKLHAIEALLVEARAMTACHNLLCDQECDCLNCKFWNKPEIKKLLEEVKGE